MLSRTWTCLSLLPEPSWRGVCSYQTEVGGYYAFDLQSEAERGYLVAADPTCAYVLQTSTRGIAKCLAARLVIYNEYLNNETVVPVSPEGSL